MPSTRILFESPGKVVVDRFPTAPVIPKPTEIVLRNLCSLVSAGTELACLTGTESWFPLPGTPGYAAVGEILAVGPGGSRFQPGDRVLTHGPHAGSFTIDTTDRYTGTCVRLPASLPPERAVFARLASIALAAVRTAHIELGDYVLVAGLGLIGNFAAQFAALQGATVVATDPCARRREAAVACGIHRCLDSSTPTWTAAARAATPSRAFDCVIDATGLSSVLTEGLDLLLPGGEAILLGTPRQPWTTDATAIYRRVHLQSAVRLKGALEWLFPTFRQEFTKHSIERNTEIILELIATGRLEIRPLHSHTVSPEDAASIYSGLQADRDAYLGVVFDWR